MSNRQELEAKIEAALRGKIKPEVSAEVYEYFCSNIKPDLVAKATYNVSVNNSNNTLTLMLESDALSEGQLFTIWGILNQHKNI